MIFFKLNLWYSKKCKVDKSILLNHLKMPIQKEFIISVLIYLIFLFKKNVAFIQSNWNSCWYFLRKTSPHIL